MLLLVVWVICVGGLGLWCFAGVLEWFGFGVLGLLLVCCCVWMLVGLFVVFVVYCLVVCVFDLLFVVTSFVGMLFGGLVVLGCLDCVVFVDC